MFGFSHAWRVERALRAAGSVPRRVWEPPMLQGSELGPVATPLQGEVENGPE